MCVPSGGIIDSSSTGIIGGVIKGVSAITNGIDAISDYKENKANNIYRTQIALNNAQAAKNEALRQKQLGIEKSRMEKISGLQEINKLKAQKSASNFDLMSFTNQYTYQDINNLSELNSSSIKQEYEINSSKYFNQANSYLNQAQQHKKQYNNSVFDSSLNALGKINQVANNWYEHYKEGL